MLYAPHGGHNLHYLRVVSCILQQAQNSYGVAFVRLLKPFWAAVSWSSTRCWAVINYIMSYVDVLLCVAHLSPNMMLIDVMVFGPICGHNQGAQASPLAARTAEQDVFIGTHVLPNAKGMCYTRHVHAYHHLLRAPSSSRMSSARFF